VAEAEAKLKELIERLESEFARLRA
jgi:hypothetical protein